MEPANASNNRPEIGKAAIRRPTGPSRVRNPMRIARPSITPVMISVGKWAPRKTRDMPMRTIRVAARRENHLRRAVAASRPQNVTAPWAWPEGRPNDGWGASARTSELTQ